MPTNKVLKFYNEQIKSKRIRVAKAEKEYLDFVQANVRYFMKWGYFDENMKQRQLDSYLRYCRLYGEYLVLQEKYYRVKGCEQCQGENR